MIGGGRPTVSSGATAYRRASAEYASDRTGNGGRGAPGGGGGGGGGGGEEDVELELALAISKEEHAEELKRREAEGLKDDLKLKMALEASKKEVEDRKKSVSSGGLVDLIDTSLSAAPSNGPDPWGAPAAPLAASAWSDPWSAPHASASSAAPVSNPTASDPWAFSATPSQPQAGGGTFDYAFGSPDEFSKSATSDPWSASSAAAAPAGFPAAGSAADSQQPPRAKSAHSFLGDHGNLVNLDSLVAQPKGSTNPFAPVIHGPSHPSNPFHSTQPVQPTLSELQRRAAYGGDTGFGVSGNGSAGGVLPPPLIEAPQQPPPLQPPAYPAAFNPWGQQQQPPAAAGYPSHNPFM
ncbi:hypothetical protein BOX15_Mlig018284g1 [Macrostomum lignano]|uniref:ENTH domain-containing protein n=1 Tax=Macrostomum lignano TaxID=282301 RepID=A0A267ESV9_9PLAT|nr:hypothetical protein BOX15_Mlig018284g1 [Macrostomum lignano]